MKFIQIQIKSKFLFVLMSALFSISHAMESGNSWSPPSLLSAESSTGTRLSGLKEIELHQQSALVAFKPNKENRERYPISYTSIYHGLEVIEMINAGTTVEGLLNHKDKLESFFTCYHVACNAISISASTKPESKPDPKKPILRIVYEKDANGLFSFATRTRYDPSQKALSGIKCEQIKDKWEIIDTKVISIIDIMAAYDKLWGIRSLPLDLIKEIWQYLPALMVAKSSTVSTYMGDLTKELLFYDFFGGIDVIKSLKTQEAYIRQFLSLYEANFLPKHPVFYAVPNSESREHMKDTADAFLQMTSQHLISSMFLYSKILMDDKDNCYIQGKGLKFLPAFPQLINSLSLEEIEGACSFPGLRSNAFVYYLYHVLDLGITPDKFLALGKNGILTSVRPYYIDNCDGKSSLKPFLEASKNMSGEEIEQWNEKRYSMMTHLVAEVTYKNFPKMIEAMRGVPDVVLEAALEKVREELAEYGTLSSGARIDIIRKLKGEIISESSFASKDIDRRTALTLLFNVDMRAIPEKDAWGSCKDLSIDQVLALTKLNRLSINNFDKIRHIEDYQNLSAQQINDLADIINFYDDVFFPESTYGEYYPLIMAQFPHFKVEQIRAMAKQMPKNPREYDITSLMMACRDSLRDNKDLDAETAIARAISQEELKDYYRLLVWS